MPSYLDQIAARAKDEDATVLLWEVAQAFDEAPADAACRHHPRARELHELIQFAKFDLLAPWLQERRESTRRACAFARRAGLVSLADTLQAALDAGHGDDIAISQLMEDFDTAVLHELLAARGQFDLRPSRAAQARIGDDARILHRTNAGAAALVCATAWATTRPSRSATAPTECQPPRTARATSSISCVSCAITARKAARPRYMKPYSHFFAVGTA
jgi:hypothetical protein